MREFEATWYPTSKEGMLDSLKTFVEGLRAEWHPTTQSVDHCVSTEHARTAGLLDTSGQRAQSRGARPQPLWVKSCVSSGFCSSGWLSSLVRFRCWSEQRKRKVLVSISACPEPVARAQVAVDWKRPPFHIARKESSSGDGAVLAIGEV